MAPVVSPKKTWEGAAGGVLGSVAGALVAHAWFFNRLPVGHAVALGVLLCGAGILGDLAESMLKRAAGVKDSSALLPGHGGVLDRVDSLLVAAPVLYYYWGVFLAGAR
jgi:phosphatidate cytidylyltransferase